MKNIFNKICSYFKNTVTPEHTSCDNEPHAILIQAINYFRQLDIDQCYYDFDCKIPYIETVDKKYRMENNVQTKVGITITVLRDPVVITNYIDSSVANQTAWRELAEHMQEITDKMLLDAFSSKPPKQLELFNDTP